MGNSMRRRKFYKKIRTKYDAKGGILSCMMALLSICVFLLGVLFSLTEGGEAGIMAGKIAAASMLLSFAGFVVGIASFKEKDKFERFSWAGSLANGVILVTYVCMLLIFS